VALPIAQAAMARRSVDSSTACPAWTCASITIYLLFSLVSAAPFQRR
jgi:hypothetical protein